jgi:rRNA-processing protein FCF1
VVVASNDRAVREDAERRGANVISVGQLMAVLRREP